MGPLLLSRLLDLNDTQEGVLNIAFKIADDEGLLLLDLKDLRALLVEIAERAAGDSARYGNVARPRSAPSSARCWCSSSRAATHFFGERALDIADLMRTDPDGRGFISVLAADELMRSPRLYATFLLWLLSELFEELPEVGDPDKPKLVFFFDEAHLLFDDAPKALVDKVEQVVQAGALEGRRRLFRDAEPARCSRDGAGPARQPRAARAARLYAARAEGGAGRGRDVPAQPGFRPTRRSPSSAPARRWFRCSRTRAFPRWWSAR